MKSYNTLIIGTGCAGFNAADKLFDLGVRDIAIVTEGRFMGTSRNTGSDKQTYYKLSLCGSDGDSVREMAGTLYSGGDVNLDLTLEVPITLGDEFQDAIGYIDWQFKVEAFPISPDDPDAPQTGDNSLILWGCVGAVALTMVLIPIVSRKRRGEAE